MKEVIVESRAPARINDLGGWTDTWFSGRGAVLSVAVLPGAFCRVSLARNSPSGRGKVTLEVKDFADRYSFDPVEPRPGRHPLIEEAVAFASRPSGVSAELEIWSGMPPGCGTGTSAAMGVAIIGALEYARDGCVERERIWKEAHRVETELLGWQSGVQDQIGAAYGGISFIDIPRYPLAEVTGIEPADSILSEMEERILLVHMGESRKSSEIHDKVIEEITAKKRETDVLAALREIPVKGRLALMDGDLKGYGKAMIENTELQRALHPSLVPEEAERVIHLARGTGAWGWKVNGAGGSGGSLTVLMGGDREARSAFLDGIESMGGGTRNIPVTLDRKGLSVRRVRPVEGEPPT